MSTILQEYANKTSEIYLTNREIIRFKLANEYFNRISGNRILDIGCRDGVLRTYLTKEYDYWGIDIVDNYRKYVQNLMVIDITKDRIPCEDNFFDFIHVGEVMEHLSNFFFTFEELYRVLKPGGLVFISVPNNMDLLQALAPIYKKRYKRRRLNKESIKKFGSHIHSFCEMDFTKICDLVGFEPYDCDRIYNVLKGKKLPEFSIFKIFANFLIYVMTK